MNLVSSGVNLTLNFPAMWRRLRPRSDLGCRRAQASQGQALRVAAKDAASLDRPARGGRVSHHLKTGLQLHIVGGPPALTMPTHWVLSLVEYCAQFFVTAS